MAQDVIYPREGSMWAWEKGKIIVLGWNVLQISIRSNWSFVSFKVCVSLLIFCLVDWSIGVSGVLNSPTVIVLLLISPFILVSIYLTYCGAPMLGAYIFIIVMSSSWIDPLIIMWCPSLSLFTAFILKSILSDMSIATPAFFRSLFAWNIFFQPFTFSLYVSLVLRWVSYRQPKAERIQQHQTSSPTNTKGSSLDRKHRKGV